TTGADGAPRRPGAAAFGPQRALLGVTPVRRASTLAGVAGFGRGRVLRVTVEQRRTNPLLPRAFVLRSNGRVVARGPQMLRVTLGANARGDAAIAWWERTNRFSRLFVAVRRAGRPFGRPVRLAPRGFGDVAVAIGPRGAVLAR